MIRLLIPAPIRRALTWAGAGILAVLGAFALGRKDGAQRRDAQAQEDDYEVAQDIRSRVDNADQLVRRFDDAGYRDSE